LYLVGFAAVLSMLTRNVQVGAGRQIVIMLVRGIQVRILDGLDTHHPSTISCGLRRMIEAASAEEEDEREPP